MKRFSPGWAVVGSMQLVIYETSVINENNNNNFFRFTMPFTAKKTAASYKSELNASTCNVVTVHSLSNRLCFPIMLTPVVFPVKLLQRSFTNH